MVSLNRPNGLRVSGAACRTGRTMRYSLRGLRCTRLLDRALQRVLHISRAISRRRIQGGGRIGYRLTASHLYSTALTIPSTCLYQSLPRRSNAAYQRARERHWLMHTNIASRAPLHTLVRRAFGAGYCSASIIAVMTRFNSGTSFWLIPQTISRSIPR
jgi:hypothetical protein